MIEAIPQMNGWRGMRQSNLDTFSGGSDVNLTSVGWTALAGTIRSNGTGLAYCNLGGIGIKTSFYTNKINGNSNNRIIRCDVSAYNLRDTGSGGLMIVANGTKQFSAIVHRYNTVTGYADFSLIENYGTAVSSSLGTIFAEITASYKLTTIGRTCYYDIAGGTLTGSVTLSGNALMYWPSGLYAELVSGSNGVNFAGWENFDVRMMAK